MTTHRDKPAAGGPPAKPAGGGDKGLAIDTSRLRLADGEHPIRAGDFIAAPAGGVETAHQIINDSDQPLTYLCVSTMIEPEVLQYPDSGKLGAIAGSAPGGAKGERTLYWFGKTGEGCGYWEGE